MGEILDSTEKFSRQIENMVENVDYPQTEMLIDEKPPQDFFSEVYAERAREAQWFVEGMRQVVEKLILRKERARTLMEKRGNHHSAP